MLKDRIVASITDKYFTAGKSDQWTIEWLYDPAARAVMDRETLAQAIAAAFDAGVKLGAAAADGKEILVKRSPTWPATAGHYP